MLGAERAASRNTLAAYRADLADLAAHLGRPPADAVPDELSAYFAALSRAGFSPRTAERRRLPAAPVLPFPDRRGSARRRPHYPPRSPAPRPHPPAPPLGGRNRTPHRCRRHPARTPRAARRAAILLLYTTGLRVSELLALPRTAFARGDRTIVIRGKGGRERLVPLSPEIHDAVAVLIAQSPRSRFVFPGRDPARRSPARASTSSSPTPSAPPASTPAPSPRTCCATPSPATCSPAAPTCAISRCSSATPTSPALRSTPTCCPSVSAASSRSTIPSPTTPLRRPTNPNVLRPADAPFPGISRSRSPNSKARSRSCAGCPIPTGSTSPTSSSS